MRHHLITFIAGATLLAPAAATAQSLASRIAAAPADGVVRFTFESKPGVCGDGESIRVRRPGDDVTIIQGRRGYSMRDGDLSECVEGPVQMELTRANGRVTDAHMRVGGAPRTGGTDIGSARAADAVEYLLSEETLRNAHEDAGERMVFATTLANSESWPGLLRIARAQQLEEGVRRSAVFWVAQAAGDKATEGLTSIAGDESDEIEIRKQAVFALSQIGGDRSVDALIDIARANREPEIRRSAIFWLGQSRSPRALAFFEDLLRG